MAKQSSERAHSRAKHKARWRKPDSEQTRQEDEERTAWRRDYYRKARPDIDPQSDVSRALEFLGLDEPYTENADSYDYRRREWDESVARGNPDMTWFLPEVSSDSMATNFPAAVDYVASGIRGGPEVDNLETPEGIRNTLRQAFGREPTDEEMVKATDAVRDPNVAFDNMTRYLGREPTEEEMQQWLKFAHDPRTRDEKNAGAMLALNPLDFFGVADETAAGVGALFGRDYDEELAKARATQQRYDALEDPWSWRNVAATAGSTAGALVGPVASTFKAFETGVRGLRAAVGLAPEATTRLGRAATTVASGAPAGATDLTAMQIGSGEGGLESRLSAVDPTLTIGGAVGGGLLWPLIGAGAQGIYKGTKKAMGIPQALAKRFRRKPKPKPGTPPRTPGIGDDTPPQWPRPKPPLGPMVTAATGTPPWLVADRQSVRSAINAAMRPRTGIGAGLVAGGALGGAAIMAGNAADERKRKRRR